MKIDVAAPNAYTRELTIELPWQEIAPDFESTLRKFNRKLRLPGFRPGKTPRKVLMQQFKSSLEVQFLEDTIHHYYMRAVQEQELVPVNQGSVRDVGFQYEQPLTFKAVFEVEPEIRIPDLKKNSLKVNKTVYITDARDVEDTIEELRHRYAEVRTVEEGAKLRDFLIADLQKLDPSGVPIIGRKYEKRYLRIGEGTFGGENQARMLGAKPGDTIRLDIPNEDGSSHFPYQATVINVEEQLLPDVDLEFIRKVDPQARDEADWRRRLQEQIETGYARKAEETFERVLSDAMIDLVDPPTPQSMVSGYLDHLLEDARAGHSGELDEQLLRERYRPAAERNLKWYLIRKALIAEQDLSIPAAEIEAVIQKLIERSPAQEKQIRNYYRKPSHRARIEDDLVEDRILNYLKQFAKIKEVKIHTRDLRKHALEEQY